MRLLYRVLQKLAMASKPAQHVTLDEFYQNEERFIQEMREKVEKLYVQRVERILEQCHVRPAIAKSLAEGVIRNGETYMSNAQECDDDETEQVDAIANEYRQFLDVAVLFIEAPLEHGKRTLKYDAKSRHLQYKNFIERHPSLKKENQKVHKEEKKVEDYEEMKMEILDFIKEHASRAIIAPVFFNGHGTENGICFHKNKDGKDVPLQTVIQDLEEVVKATRSASELQWPGSVELIFCQCFAHQYSQPDSPDFEVYHFTDEKFTKTFVREKRDKLTEDVVDAHHEELEADIPDTQKRWDEKIAKVDGRPATSVIEGLTEGIDELKIFEEDVKIKK